MRGIETWSTSFPTIDFHPYAGGWRVPVEALILIGFAVLVLLALEAG
jgi:hypothetical protein